MSFVILKSGLLDTIQDRGRFGYRSLGINTGGAMDAFSLQVANLLVGNDPGEGAIEMHFPAASFLITQPCLLALAGADFTPTLNGEPIPLLQPILAKRHDVLQFESPRSGARTYLAVHGGWRIPRWLGSKSTHLQAHTGGWEGRALKEKDELPLQQMLPSRLAGINNIERIFPWKAATDWNDEAEGIAVLPGPEWERLGPASKERFYEEEYRILNQSDRMGYRLDHAPLLQERPEEMISSGVLSGTIQLLPGGKLIVLMADHQATGGYPRIGQVITAHLPKLAQCRAGDRIQFRPIALKKAEELLLKQREHLLRLQNACTFRLQPFLHARHP